MAERNYQKRKGKLTNEKEERGKEVKREERRERRGRNEGREGEVRSGQHLSHES